MTHCDLVSDAVTEILAMRLPRHADSGILSQRTTIIWKPCDAKRRSLPKALVAWSSGKDSAWALHEARGEYDVVGALTTVTDAFARVSMHGVREELLRAQLAAAGLAADHRAHSLSVPERNL